MKTTEEAIAWIQGEAHLAANNKDLFEAYILCFGDYPDMRLSIKAITNRLIDYADGYRYAQDE